MMWMKQRFLDLIRSGSNPDPIRIQSGFNPDPRFRWQKTEEKIFFSLFLIKSAVYLCQIYRRSLQLSKENIQHFKKIDLLTYFYVCGLFLPSWFRIKKGSRDTIDSGSNPDPDSDPDPDPQHWNKEWNHWLCQFWTKVKNLLNL